MVAKTGRTRKLVDFSYPGYIHEKEFMTQPVIIGEFIKISLRGSRTFVRGARTHVLFSLSPCMFSPSPAIKTLMASGISFMAYARYAPFTFAC